MSHETARVITDANYREFLQQQSDAGMVGFGALPRQTQPGGIVGVPMMVEKVPLIPESEWPDRIRHMTANKLWIGDRWQSDVKADYQNGYGYCFPAGTLIRMADGSEKPIQQVKVLDEVVSAEGNVRKVMQVICHRHTGKIGRLLTWGHRHLRATLNHPILTPKGYVQLGDLASGDSVLFTRYLPQNTNLILTSQFISDRFLVREKARDKAGKAWNTARSCSYAARKAGTWEQVPVPDAIALTERFGRLVGLFVAEGHTDAGKVVWSFGSHEKPLHEEVVDIIHELFDVNASMQERSNNVTQIVLHGTRWAKLFEGLFCSGASRKRLPPELLSGPKDFLRGVLTGWRDGDRKRGDSGATISYLMARNMFDIANGLGYLPRFERMPPKTDRNGSIHQEAWVVYWTENPSKLLKTAVNARYGIDQDDKAMRRNVESVKTEDFDDYVFNLEVETDHSYVAEGIGVHNCWAYSLAQSVMAVRAAQGQPFVQLSPESLAEDVNYRNAGNYLDSALAYAAKNGIATRATVPQHKIKESQWDAAYKEERTHYIPSEWWDLDGRDVWRSTVTALLLGYGCYVGYDFWSHAVWLDRLRIGDNGKIEVHTPNSHGPGQDVWLAGSKAIPSMGSFVLRAVTWHE